MLAYHWRTEYDTTREGQTTMKDLQQKYEGAGKFIRRVALTCKYKKINEAHYKHEAKSSFVLFAFQAQTVLLISFKTQLRLPTYGKS